MAELVLAVLLPSLKSLAVMVKLPLVPNARVKLPVPANRAASGGRDALRSLELRSTTSLTLPTTFQLASTALTVVSKLTPTICALGVPVLPVAEPGAALSPGTSNWNLANAPALTVTLALVPAVKPVAEAVMVRVPAGLEGGLERTRVAHTRGRVPGVAPVSSAILALLSVAARGT